MMAASEPYILHQQMVDAVRRSSAPLEDQPHRLAMLAKESIFRAQDALRNLDDNAATRKLERQLAKVRTALEALDRDWRNRRVR